MGAQSQGLSLADPDTKLIQLRQYSVQRGAFAGKRFLGLRRQGSPGAILKQQTSAFGIVAHGHPDQSVRVCMFLIQLGRQSLAQGVSGTVKCEMLGVLGVMSFAAFF